MLNRVLRNSVFLTAFLAFATTIMIGQDLGSSNKLFGKPKATPTKTTKKPAAKPKTEPAKGKTTTTKASTAKPKPTVKTPASNAKTAKKAVPPKKEPAASTSTKSKYTEFKANQPSKVEITVGKAKPNLVSTPTNNDERLEDLIQSGNEARDDRNYSAAETSYKAARTLKPKDSRPTYGLGNLYSDQQRWEEAESAYRSALQLDPDNAIVHVALSYVLTQPIAAPNLSERYEEAEKLAQKAIQLAPSNALAFDQLGIAQELRGLIGAETENAYRKAIKLSPSFAPAYAHLGRLLRRRGLNKESAAAYEDAIKRSNDVATMILVADVMQSEQRYAESEKLLHTALNGDPKNPAAMLLLGRALTALGKYSDAEHILRSSLSVSTNGFAANSLLGTLYSRQGNFGMAESTLLEALKTVSPLEKRGLSQQFEVVGDGFLKDGDKRGAERAYRQAIALDGENQGLVTKLTKAQRG
ncbi:MAG: tetratricopeptide repeat protein [Pyrinomonadaceae bacterium]